MFILPRLTLATLAAGLLLAGCADKPVARTNVAATPANVTAQSTTRTGDSVSASAPERRTSERHMKKEALPEQTGIAACDDYLSSYLACHQAAAIYPADQLQTRYQTMRNGLLRDSQNPDIRPQLAARCNSLASSLRDALHGKPCAASPAPAPAATSP